MQGFKLSKLFHLPETSNRVVCAVHAVKVLKYRLCVVWLFCVKQIKPEKDALLADRLNNNDPERREGGPRTTLLIPASLARQPILGSTNGYVVGGLSQQ